jgi:hypothetical protein
MADGFNFLSTSGSKDGKDPKKASLPGDDLAMHVPTPPPAPEKPKAPPAPPAPPAPKPPEPPKDVFSQKIAPVPPPPPVLKPAPAALKPPAPPAPPKPAPTPPSPKPGPVSMPPVKPTPPPVKLSAPPPKPSGTLRVSLISTAGGSSLSELTVSERMRGYVLILLVAVVVDALMYGGLLYHRAQVVKRIAGIEEGVKQLDDDIVKTEKAVLPAKNLQGLVDAADKALTSHVYWTNLLQFFQEVVHPHVQLSGINATEKGNVSTRISAKDMKTLAEQIVVLRKDPRVKAAEIGSVAASFGDEGQPGEVNTSLELSIDPAVFKFVEKKK